MRDFYRTVLKISDNDLLNQLCSETEVRTVEKGDLIIRMGDIQEKLGFLDEGVVRGYYIDDDYAEITDSFIIYRGTPIVSDNILNEPLISTLYYKAVTDVKLFCLPVKTITELIRTNSDMMQFYHKFLLKQTEFHRSAKQAIVRYKSVDLIRWFEETYPGAVEIIPHMHIASFLGMSPVHFSRARKQLEEQRQAAQNAEQ